MMHIFPLVYLAGPYSRPDPVENTNTAISIAEDLMETGLLTPLVPHLTLLWNLVAPHDEDYWYAYDLELLSRCDALYRFPGDSRGADREVVWAEKRRIPTFFARDRLLSYCRIFAARTGETG